MTWNKAVSILGSIQTSVYIYLVPVITALTSFLILQESISMKKLIGIIFTICGLFLSQDLQKKESTALSIHKQAKTSVPKDIC